MSSTANSFTEFAERVDYSLLERLHPDPEATADGIDHRPRPVCSGHWVPVTPTPIPNPEYVAHSHTLFAELGLDDALAQDPAFTSLFSGDASVATPPMAAPARCALLDLRESRCPPLERAATIAGVPSPSTILNEGRTAPRSPFMAGSLLREVGC